MVSIIWFCSKNRCAFGAVRYDEEAVLSNETDD